MRMIRWVTLSASDVENLILDYIDDVPNGCDDRMLCMKSYIKGLSHRDQVVLVLYLEGYTSRTIAAYLEISHTSVQNYIKRMKRDLLSCGHTS